MSTTFAVILKNGEQHDIARRVGRGILGCELSFTNKLTELISDYNEMYDYVYLKNWGLFFSIIVAGIAISKVFANNNVNPKIV